MCVAVHRVEHRLCNYYQTTDPRPARVGIKIVGYFVLTNQTSELREAWIRLHNNLIANAPPTARTKKPPLGDSAGLNIGTRPKALVLRRIQATACGDGNSKASNARSGRPTGMYGSLIRPAKTILLYVAPLCPLLAAAVDLVRARRKSFFAHSS